MILVTGTSGALGGLIVRRLAERGGLAVVAGTRAPSHSPLRQTDVRRVGVRQIDFDRPDTLVDGFAGVEVLVFVSAGYAEDDVVLDRHGAVVEAAGEAGVRHVIYTSLAGSGDQLTIALAHRWTEARLAEAPFDVTVLRNGLYAEIPAGLALAAAESAATSGVFASPMGAGRVGVVAREDLADAAARVAAETQADLAAGGASRHAGRTYELEGVAAIGGATIAATLTEVMGVPIRYEPASLGETRAALNASGLEPYQVAHSVSTFSNINAGFLEPRDSDLPTLLGVVPRPVVNLVAAAVAAGGFTSRSVTAGRSTKTVDRADVVEHGAGDFPES